MASSPRAGTSSGSSCPFEVDVDLFFGEDQSPHFKELLTLNRLRIVSEDWIASTRSNAAAEKDRHEEALKKLEKEVRALRASREKANKQINGLKKEGEELRKQIREKEDRSKSEIENLQKKLEESKQDAEELRTRVANQQGICEDILSQSTLETQRIKTECSDTQKKLEASEQNVELLKSQLNQANEKIAAEELANKKLVEGKEELERKFNEDRVKRGNEIVAQKNEKERLIREQYKFMGFIRQLKNCCGFVTNEDDIVSQTLLEQLYDHVQKLLKKSSEDNEELVRNRGLLEQIESLLQNARMASAPSASAPSNSSANIGSSGTFASSTENPDPQSLPRPVTVTPPASPPAAGVITTPQQPVQSRLASETTSVVGTTPSVPPTTAAPTLPPTPDETPRRPSTPSSNSVFATSAPPNPTPKKSASDLRSENTQHPPSGPRTNEGPVRVTPQVPAPKSSTSTLPRDGTKTGQPASSTPSNPPPRSDAAPPPDDNAVPPRPPLSSTKSAPPITTPKNSSSEPRSENTQHPPSASRTNEGPVRARPQVPAPTKSTSTLPRDGTKTGHPASSTPSNPPPISDAAPPPDDNAVPPRPPLSSTSTATTIPSSLVTPKVPKEKSVRWSSIVARTITASLEGPPCSTPATTATPVTATEPTGSLRNVVIKTDPDAPSTSQRPSIVLPLETSGAPKPASTSSPPGESEEGNRTKESVKQARNYRQFTEFAVSDKRHGVNKACAQFRCLCGNVYLREKGLKVHVRKMTQEWKYPCEVCKQYFFYKSDLNRHLIISSCGGNAAAQAESILDEILGMPPPQQQQPPPSQQQQCPPQQQHRPPPPHQTPRKRKAPSDGDVIGSSAEEFMLADLFSTPSRPQQGSPPPATASTSTAAAHIAGSKSTQNSSNRKLQQEILKRKKHAPWSKKGPVQGHWYCVCGSRFSSKTNLQTHVQYFTIAWKFKCDQCPQKFLYLGYLKKHMTVVHKIRDPFKEYSMGCQLCGEMFHKKPQYYAHRKSVHNLHISHTKQKSSRSVPLAQQEQPTQGPSSKIASPSADQMDVIDVPSDDEEAVVNPQSPLLSTAAASSASGPPEAQSSTASAGPRSPLAISNTVYRRQRHGPVDQDPLSFEFEGPNPQQHPCECGKIYKSRTALNHHVKTMKFGKIFVCIRCSKGFSQLVNLKNHMASVHEESYKGFNCGLCGQLFASSILFKTHRMQQHGNM